MPDWTKSMQQTFEYQEVDPYTWGDKGRIDSITSCNIKRDRKTDTLGNASIESTSDIGERYIRPYLITIQNHIKERFPLGTFLCQSPRLSYDGKNRSLSIDAYTPLIELKEKYPPIGYSIAANANTMETAYRIVRENVRAPVVASKGLHTLESPFVSELDDDWFVFTNDLIARANYHFALDELSRILFMPNQDFNSMTSTYEYNDGNSSILMETVDIDQDIFGIPNVLEVVFSKDDKVLYSRVENNDPNSPISTVNRGRQIIQRITNPDGIADYNQQNLDDYALYSLRDLSTLECTISYTHGYCPVNIDDCVTLNYRRAGLNNVKAKVVSQSIKCETGCTVEETAVFTANLWR